MHELVRKTEDRYAVVFRERGERSFAGSLELDSQRVLLTGTAEGRRHTLDFALVEIVEIRIGRLAADRLNGYRTLVLERQDAPAVQIAPLETSLLRELAELLAALTGDQTTTDEELVVVVPLKDGCGERVRALLELGPPLDPAGLGLTAHRVYLHDREALFVFTGPHVRTQVGKAMRSPTLWRAGLGWRDCIAHKPQIVEPERIPPAETSPDYAWTSTN